MCEALRQQLKQNQEGPCAPCGETDVRPANNHEHFHSDLCTEGYKPQRRGECSKVLFWVGMPGHAPLRGWYLSWDLTGGGGGDELARVELGEGSSLAKGDGSCSGYGPDTWGHVAKDRTSS